MQICGSDGAGTRARAGRRPALGILSNASADAVESEIARFTSLVIHPHEVPAALLAKLGQPLLREAHALELLRRPELSFDDLCAVAAPDGDSSREEWRTDERLAEQVKLQVDVQAKYSGYLKRQSEEIDRQQRHEQLGLPADLDYALVAGLSNEARQSLSAVRPQTLGQAARIPGLTPAAVSLLLVYLKKRDRAA